MTGPTAADRYAVLLDMDGVVADTEELKKEAHGRAIAELGGDPGRLPDYARVMGRSHEDVARMHLDAAGLDAGVADYGAAFDRCYAQLLRDGVRPVAGAPELLAALGERGYRLALISASERWMVDEVVRQLELADHFGVRVSADDVPRTKPHPDPYARALETLDVAPERAVALEDSETGVASAVAAGARVIALRHRYNGDHDFSAAFAVLDSLTDTPEVLAPIDAALGPAGS